MVIIVSKFNYHCYSTIEWIQLSWLESIDATCFRREKQNKSFLMDLLLIPDVKDFYFSAWKWYNHLIHSWIINFVTTPIAQKLVLHDNAIDFWQDLQQRFSKAGRVLIVTLQSIINNLPQGSKYVLDYFTEIKTIENPTEFPFHIWFPISLFPLL